MNLILLIGIWLACAPFAYAASFSYWQRAYPELAAQEYWRDIFDSAATALLFGPIQLILALMWQRWFGLRARKEMYGLKWR